MRNLLNFIIRYSTAFVFSFYVLLSLILLSYRDDYHASVVLSSANSASGEVYRASTGISGYFNLKQINQSLQESNANLENEILNLRNELAGVRTQLSDSDSTWHSSVGGGNSPRRFDYILASVINNSTRHPRNYFTIDKGEKDGIKPGMGVVDHNGIVGIVNVAGPHTSRIISILNQTQHFSVKLKDTPFVGSLSWHGEDPGIAYMEEVPRHAKFRTGDTIVTSGYSTTFPYGIMIGTVMNRVKTTDDNFYILKIRLSSNFKTLSTVRVLKDSYKNELDSLATYDIKVDE